MQQKDVLILLGLLREVVHYWKELRVLYPATVLDSVQFDQFISKDNDNIMNNNSRQYTSNAAYETSECLHQFAMAPVGLRDFENIRLNSKV